MEVLDELAKRLLPERRRARWVQKACPQLLSSTWPVEQFPKNPSSGDRDRLVFRSGGERDHVVEDGAPKDIGRPDPLDFGQGTLRRFGAGAQDGLHVDNILGLWMPLGIQAF